MIFLSADAFGVLPPVSILTPEQTQYYFLSGFTAKLAGTERGITEPTPTFSACFGQAFLELHPTKYAEELVKKMKASGAKAYLVNTGWNGTGKRISIKDTRGIIDAILSGAINEGPTKKIPYFDFEVPTVCPAWIPPSSIPATPTQTLPEWEEKAKDLAGRFVKNFAKAASSALRTPPAGLKPTLPSRFPIVIPDRLAHHHRRFGRGGHIDLAGRSLDEIGPGEHRKQRCLADQIGGFQSSGLDNDL